MVGIVALVQGFGRGRDLVLGVVTAVLVAVSYAAPAADRAWRSVVEGDADRIMARCGLAGPLCRFVQWRHARNRWNGFTVSGR